MSSDITAAAAREVVAAWVAAQAVADPAFRGAFYTGSITALPDHAPVPRTSDVDVTVVVAAAALDHRKGKRLVDGLLVDASYLDEAALADPARVATSFVYAPSFRGGQVVADPTGHLGRLEAAISPGFAAPAAVRARTADVHRRIRARLTALDPDAPWADLVLTWLFPTTLTAVAALVAASRPPTVRQRYLRARDVVPAADYERLLALLGCADVPPELVERHLDAVTARFDETAALLAAPPAGAAAPAAPAGTAASAGAAAPADSAAEDGAPAAPSAGPCSPAGAVAPTGSALPAGPPVQATPAPPADAPPLPYAADLTAAARPVAIDGSRALVAAGDHREAVFWIVATAARCQAALTARAPHLARDHEPGFRALVADLVGLRGPTDVLTRRDALLATLPLG